MVWKWLEEKRWREEIAASPHFFCVHNGVQMIGREDMMIRKCSLSSPSLWAFLFATGPRISRGAPGKYVQIQVQWGALWNPKTDSDKVRSDKNLVQNNLYQPTCIHQWPHHIWHHACKDTLPCIQPPTWWWENDYIFRKNREFRKNRRYNISIYIFKTFLTSWHL